MTRRANLALVMLLLVLNALDAGATLWWMAHSTLSEANPILPDPDTHPGLFLLAKFGLLLGALWLLFRLAQPRHRAWALRGTCGFYGAIAGYHLYLAATWG